MRTPKVTAIMRGVVHVESFWSLVLYAAPLVAAAAAGFGFAMIDWNIVVQVLFVVGFVLFVLVYARLAMWRMAVERQESTERFDALQERDEGLRRGIMFVGRKVAEVVDGQRQTDEYGISVGEELDEIQEALNELETRE